MECWYTRKTKWGLKFVSIQDKFKNGTHFFAILLLHTVGLKIRELFNFDTWMNFGRIVNEEDGHNDPDRSHYPCLSNIHLDQFMAF